MKDFLKIVLVDDDEDDQFICREAIKSITSINCLTTLNNGRGLLDMLSGREVTHNGNGISPDLIILDINMPVVDGLQVLARMREENLHRHTPVFILTTSNKQEHISRAYELGVKKFYTKPHSISGFEQIFREILDAV